MTRFLSSIRKDVVIQARKKFYAVSLTFASLTAAIFSIYLDPQMILKLIPATILILSGMSLIFVGILIAEENEKGILKALMYSPLTIGEYLGAKIISLTILGNIEMGIMIAGPLYYFHVVDDVELPNMWIFFIGLTILNLIYTIIGVIISVRFKKLTDMLFPITAIVILLEIPAVHFSDLLTSNFFLTIPSSAPVVLIQSAFIDLSSTMWIYTIAYNAFLLVLLSWWAKAAYNKHILLKMG